MSEDLAAIKAQALADYGAYCNPMKLRTLRHAGLEIIEGRREGAGRGQRGGCAGPEALPAGDARWALAGSDGGHCGLHSSFIR